MNIRAAIWRLLKSTSLILVLILSYNISNAQDTLDLKAIKKTLAEIKKSLEKGDDGKDTIGFFVLKETEKIFVYDVKGLKVDSIAIKKVIIDIKDGVILDMQVITRDQRVFTNKRAPIGLTRYDRCDKIGWQSGNRTVYINTCDFSDIIRNGHSVPDNKIITLNSTDTIKTLTRGAGINQVVDLRFYSDLLATIGDEPNGIVQTEGATRIFINNRNIPNISLTPFRYGTFSVQASKLDSKFQTLPLDSTFSGVSMIQRSWLNAELGLNLMGIWIQQKSRSWASLNGGAGVHLTKVSNESDTLTRAAQYLFLEGLVEFKELSNFGIDFSSKILFQTVPGFEETFRRTRPILKIGATVYWNPKNESNNRVFARLNYFQDINESVEPFIQFQLGYSAVISSLIAK